MLRNNLITTANKAKAKIKIHENTHIDQESLMKKRPLKISINSCNQPNKAQKSGAVSQN